MLAKKNAIISQHLSKKKLKQLYDSVRPQNF